MTSVRKAVNLVNRRALEAEAWPATWTDAWRRPEKELFLQDQPCDHVQQHLENVLWETTEKVFWDKP